MGSHSGTTEPDGFYPNGLLPDEAASVTRKLHPKRWAKAEEHTAKLISRIQPNWPAEKHRNAVASYVQRLITECIMCQVFTFGSVPLKTYLPDGDIDLTAFSLNPSLKDTWAIKVRDMLEREEKNEHAEFRVKEVQYIQAEVKIIKCLVDNIVVDISFNQLGGLCTLCFLEEVDTLINQDHLFKRSIILIKAWCYYESRILGAHHGLISTYALETLVLYIFHVFNSSFTGPLEVLYRFLEFFSKFDWENFCVSLWGPVPISSLPDVTAEPPCRDGGDLLLSQMFLDACSAAFAVVPGGHENQEQPFIPKHFNIVDPLRTNNNLGRSVNKGNFFRIRSAFAFGAQRLARLLECPEVSIVAELNQFFMNTWDRHGKGLRPDASIADTSQSIIEDSEHVDNLQNYGSIKKDTENTSGLDFKVEQISSSQFSCVQRGNLPINKITKTLNESDVGPLFAKTDTNVSIKSSNQDQQNTQRSISDIELQNDTGKTGRARILQNEVPATPQFPRTYSSPELRNTSSEVMSRGRGRCNVIADRMKDEMMSSGYIRANCGSGVLDNHNGNLSTKEPLKGLVSANDSNCSTDCSVDESVSGAYSRAMHAHEEEKDFVDASSSSTPPNFVGQVQMPMNFASQLPVPIPASFWDYAYHNSLGRIPSDLPFFGPRWDSNMYHPHVPFPLPVSQNFSGTGRCSDQEETTGRFSGDLASREVNQHGGVWTDSECSRELDDEGPRFRAQDIERKHQSTSAASNLITSVQMSNSEHHGQRIQDVRAKEKRELSKGNYTDGYRSKSDRASGEFSTASSRFSSPSIATSRTKGSSESSWDGSPSKTMHTAKARFVRKSPSAVDPVPVDSDGCQYEELIDHERGEVEGSSDHMSLPTVETVDSSVSSSLVEIHQLPGSHLAYPKLMLPVTQMPVNVGSQHRMTHNHAVLPIAFYPAGPPVPFVTMLPFYNIPSDSGTSSDSTNHFDAGDDVSSLPVSKSDPTEGTVRNLNYPGNSGNGCAVNEISSLEHSEERKSDILNSDIVSHRQNLQYGRLCQNSQSQSPLVCPPTVVPPLYLQGHYTSDGPGRLLPMNAVLYNHLINLDPRLMSVPSPQLGSSHPAGVYQHCGGEIPRSRAGTGTYLPNPKVFKDRNYSSSRHHRGNYNFDRKEHSGERETNWSANSRPRLSGRGQGRYQPDRANMRMERPPGRSSQPDRSWNQMRQYSYVPSHSTSGPSSGSRPTRYSHGNADYPMYPVPSRYDEGIPPPGDAPVVMFYPYDPTMGYGSSLGQQVRSGSVESFHSFNRDEVTEPCEYPGGAAQLPSYEGDSAGSSPDQPCSPSYMRGA